MLNYSFESTLKSGQAYLFLFEAIRRRFHFSSKLSNLQSVESQVMSPGKYFWYKLRFIFARLPDSCWQNYVLQAVPHSAWISTLLQQIGTFYIQTMPFFTNVCPEWQGREQWRVKRLLPSHPQYWLILVYGSLCQLAAAAMHRHLASICHHCLTVSLCTIAKPSPLLNPSSRVWSSLDIWNQCRRPLCG